MRKVFVRAVGVNPDSQTPVILLQEEEGSGILPIGIGHAEAQAIMVALKDIELPRPISYDLMNKILKSFDASPEKVVVNDLKDGTFYARFVIRQGEDQYTFDARPSDSIAMALRTDTPIYIADNVAHRALVSRELVEEEDVAEEVQEEREQFRDFVDEVFENVEVDEKDLDEGEEDD